MVASRPLTVSPEDFSIIDIGGEALDLVPYIHIPEELTIFGKTAEHPGNIAIGIVGDFIEDPDDTAQWPMLLIMYLPDVKGTVQDSP